MDLTEEECALLWRVVNNRMAELRDEVRHTKDSESLGYLKHKERILRRILDKFPKEFDHRAHMRGFIE